MTEQEVLRLRYLAKTYVPEKMCRTSDYECDYLVDDSNKCPCQWVQEYGWLRPCPFKTGSEPESK